MLTNNPVVKRLTSMYEKNLSQFAEDTNSGLSAHPKFLLSKYLYDTAGSLIFQDIMNIPEYYLTDSESEILTRSQESLFKEFFNNNTTVDIIELGSGDGYKTKILLECFLNKDVSFKYIPVDISEKAIRNLVDNLNAEFPALVIEEKIGDYFTVMHDLKEHDSNRKVIFFLGSNIGNYTSDQTNLFLTRLSEVMDSHDKLLIGFDLIKDPNVIFRAYNDSTGYTRDFNKNLLIRINRELDADFNLDHFVHYENYDPLNGTAKSYLVSTRKQTVSIGKLNCVFRFGDWESIYVEMSQKYSPVMIRRFAADNGYRIVAEYYDSRNYFVDSVWQLNQ